VSPWVRQRGNQLVVDHASGRVAPATIVRSGQGANDDQGEFTSHMSAERLQALGVSCPPFHALCRSTLFGVN
jgi:hypothetical protein